jgi:uncharacterized membrane protein affecting hemolysin expression
MRQPWLRFIGRHRLVTVLIALAALVILYYWCLATFTRPLL